MGDQSMDILWILVAGSLVFLMQPGFAMVESGMTRSKNSINVAVKNLTDFGVSSVLYWLLGFGLMFGPSLGGWLGFGHFVPEFGDPFAVAFLFFQTMFASTAATIVSGAVAERMRYISYIVSTALISLVVYPVFGHWAWGGMLEGTASGWLARLGFVDFAGSTVVHSLGAWVALAALLVLGPRTGRFGPEGPRVIPGSNIPMAILGVFLLWFGWFGFNGGSTLMMNEAVGGIIFHTTLGGAGGMIGAMAVGWPRYKKPDVNLLINGSLAGLVAITAGAHAIPAPWALVTGLVGGALMVGATEVLEKLRIDDAVGAIPVHLAAGVWGTLAVALFGDLEILGTGHDRGTQALVQTLGILACGAWSLGTAFVGLKVLGLFGSLRVSPEDEAMGLNKAEHGVSTEIHDLFSVMHFQAESGDMDRRAPVEPFTEAGQIARMYNQVLDKVQKGTIAKGDYVKILENLGDGMLLLDRDLVIGPYYSGAVERIFATTTVARRPFLDLVKGVLPENLMEPVRDYLAMALDKQFAWRHIERINPLGEVVARRDDGQGGFEERHLGFRFRRIEKQGQVERLLVLISDRTQEKELEAQMRDQKEQTRKEMEMLHQILHLDPGSLRQFLDDAREDSAAINERFRDSQGPMEERLEAVFRLSHGIKGNAQLLGLDLIGHKVEALEQGVKALRQKKDIKGEDFLSLTLAYSDVDHSLQELGGLVDRWMGLRAGFAQGRTEGQGGGPEEEGPAVGALAPQLASLVRRLAERYHKEAEFGAPGLDACLGRLEGPRQKMVRTVLVQLVRNAVYHGIEAPERREAAGKAPAGQVRITARERGRGDADGATLEFLVRDDGAGIDTGALRERAEALGLRPADGGPVWEGRELVGLMFHPGISTAASEDEVAGKGIGMALVRNLVRDLGGRLAVSHKAGQYTEFRISLPVRGIR